MESVGDTYCHDASPESNSGLHDLMDEINEAFSPSQQLVELEVKLEILSPDNSSFGNGPVNHVESVPHIDDVLEFKDIEIKIEREDTEEHVTAENPFQSFVDDSVLEPNVIEINNSEDSQEHVSGEDYPKTFFKNPFALIKKRLKRTRSKRRPKVEEVTEEANQIKSDHISIDEDQSHILSAWDIANSNTSLAFKEEKIDENDQNISMPHLYTIKQSELIIESKAIYENESSIRSSVVDVSTNTEPGDYNYSHESNAIVEELGTVEESLLPCYNDVPREYTNNAVTNVINNPSSYSVRIINVASWAKQDNLLNPITQPPQPTLRRKVGRPKRTAATKQISYSRSSKSKNSYKKHKKAKKISPQSISSHSNKTNNKGKYPRTNEASTKTTDFPRPLKLENASRRTGENDIATELPRPIVVKCESQFNTNFARSYWNQKMQPRVCLKRLSLHDIIQATHKPKQTLARYKQNSRSFSRPDILEVPNQLHVSDSAIVGHSSNISINKSYDIPHYIASRDEAFYHTSTPGAESSTSHSQCDSGVSTSSHSRGEYENILLEISAERAFINHHLTSFGFSPVQFELYNDFNDLCIFLKYLCGKLNTRN